MSRVSVVEYDNRWAHIYDALAAGIKHALNNDLIAVHHVGSTSVPDLAAKPRIDIVAEVKDLNFPHEGLLQLGYDYRGGYSIPLRKSFSQRGGDIDVNLHIFEQGDAEIELNLLFRDYLRTHEEAREQYQHLKYDLVQKEASHELDGSLYKGYTLGKNDFINAILEKTGFKGLRFVIVTHHKEREAMVHFRNTYFFEPAGIEDPYTWTFDHENHKHVVLYQGTQIVAYAHIQLWPKQRAALRIIAVDETKQGQGLGRKLMNFIEKWMKLEGIQSLHTEAIPKVVSFYEKSNYTPMPFDDPDGYEGGENDVAMGKILK